MPTAVSSIVADAIDECALEVKNTYTCGQRQLTKVVEASALLQLCCNKRLEQMRQPHVLMPPLENHLRDIRRQQL
jgi:hypothetical protein